MPPLKVIISGGGTGGHIFPAIAIANELKNRDSAVNILFVGAKGKMEMQKVPEAGYDIKGLDISGLRRKLDPQNLLLPFKVIGSILQAQKIIADFNPDLAVGVGGYASAPLLFAAQLKGIPTLIQEQNSYAGLTNRILGRKARKICVAYEGMGKYFSPERIVKTGNPVRNEMVQLEGKKEEALSFFGLTKDKPVVLAIGGSGGARTINEAMRDGLNAIGQKAQVIWQTGRFYFEPMAQFNSKNVKVLDFIQRMDYAYAAADIIVSRAGALSVAELCLVKKPCILIPSPNVAEDHQTKNAEVLVKANAAIMIRDADARLMLVAGITRLLDNQDLRAGLSLKIGQLAIADAAKNIVDEIYTISGAA